jgi:hypothetical protein
MRYSISIQSGSVFKKHEELKTLLIKQQAAVYGTKIFRKAQQAKASSPKLPENLFQKI